mmetsp:Transcript_55167/g.165293  ORF Transcript_55167/g.165293 Transcript_55167/m.165293 type:complete len:297 (+) Transcript_55167:112-1002(+)
MDFLPFLGFSMRAIDSDRCVDVGGVRCQRALCRCQGQGIRSPVGANTEEHRSRSRSRRRRRRRRRRVTTTKITARRRRTMPWRGARHALYTRGTRRAVPTPAAQAQGEVEVAGTTMGSRRLAPSFPPWAERARTCSIPARGPPSSQPMRRTRPTSAASRRFLLRRACGPIARAESTASPGGGVPPPSTPPNPTRTRGPSPDPNRPTRATPTTTTALPSTAPPPPSSPRCPNCSTTSTARRRFRDRSTAYPPSCARTRDGRQSCWNCSRPRPSSRRTLSPRTGEVSGWRGERNFRRG